MSRPPGYCARGPSCPAPRNEPFQIIPLWPGRRLNAGLYFQRATWGQLTGRRRCAAVRGIRLSSRGGLACRHSQPCLAASKSDLVTAGLLLSSLTLRRSCVPRRMYGRDGGILALALLPFRPSAAPGHRYQAGTSGALFSGPPAGPNHAQKAGETLAY
jgi:hypothetical protein